MHRERGHNFVCTQCDSSFADNAHLQNHFITHTKEKRYECSECHKSYSRSSSLKQHNQTHFNDPIEYICPVGDCGKHLSSKSGFINHERKHERMIENGREILSIDFDRYEHNLSCTHLNTNEEKYRLVDSLVLSSLRKVVSKYPIQHKPCPFFACRYIRNQLKRDRMVKQLLQARIDELESVLGIDSSDEESESIVLPFHYLVYDQPYRCGIPSCNQQFCSYDLLFKHASEHSPSSFFEVMNNQTILSHQNYHCPITGCEFGYGRKSLAFDKLRCHFRKTHMYHTNALKEQHISIPSESPLQSSSNPLSFFPGTIFNNGNLIIYSAAKTQSIVW